MKPVTVSAAVSLILAMLNGPPVSAAPPKVPGKGGVAEPGLEMKSVPLDLSPTGLKVSPAQPG